MTLKLGTAMYKQEICSNFSIKWKQTTLQITLHVIYICTLCKLIIENHSNEINMALGNAYYVKWIYTCTQIIYQREFKMWRTRFIKLSCWEMKSYC